MKRLITTAIFATFVSVLFAQEFVLTPLGFRDAADTSRNFVVIEKPGLTVDLLQKDVIAILTKSYNRAEDEIISEPGRVTLKTRHPNQINYRGTGGSPVVALWLRYSVTMQFKGGKFRVDDPEVSLMGNRDPITLKRKVVFYSLPLLKKAVDEQPYFLFNDKGENLSKETTDLLTKIFNDLLKQLAAEKDASDNY